MTPGSFLTPISSLAWGARLFIIRAAADTGRFLPKAKMPAAQPTSPDRLARCLGAVGVCLALAVLALVLPTPSTADHVLLADAAHAAQTWAAENFGSTASPFAAQ
jgi:hypothetical protein